MSARTSGAPTDVAPVYLDVRGHRMQVLRKGRGSPILYLHSATGETWWTDLDADLSLDFDVVHPALPGFDGSEPDPESDDIADAVFHLLDLLDCVGLERVAVVGSSLGGWLAAELALFAPERVESLVLVGAAGLEPPDVDIFATRPADLARLLFADQSHWLARLLSAIDLSAPNAPELVLPILQSMEATARIAWNPYLHDPKLVRRLHRVRAPTLVVWGDSDGLIPVAQGRRYTELIPGARLEVIEECGHLPVLERPAELAMLVRSHVGGAR